MNINISKNEPLCNCDGSIIVDVVGGNPPFNYSINEGVSYISLPIFTNLCGGTYIVSVKDSFGVIGKTSVNLNNSTIPILYNIVLNRTNKLISDNGFTKTYEINLNIDVTPKLPDYAYITFDFAHTNVSRTSPNFSASSSTTTTLLSKNLSAITYNITGTTTGETLNTYPGCQIFNTYIKSYTEVWNNLQISNIDDYNITTITTLTQNINVDCYYADVSDTYDVVNLKINNCSCCSVINI